MGERVGHSENTGHSRPYRFADILRYPESYLEADKQHASRRDALVRVADSIMKSRLGLTRIVLDQIRPVMRSALAHYEAPWGLPNATTHSTVAEMPDDSLDLGISGKTARDARTALAALQESGSSPDGIDPTAFMNFDRLLQEQIATGKKRVDLLSGGRMVPRAPKDPVAVAQESEAIYTEARSQGFLRKPPSTYRIVNGEKIAEYTSTTNKVTVKVPLGQKLPRVYVKHREDKLIIDGKGEEIPSLTFRGTQGVEIRNADLGTVTVKTGALTIHDANIQEMRVEGMTPENPAMTAATVHNSAINGVVIDGAKAQVDLESTHVVSAIVKGHSKVKVPAASAGHLVAHNSDFGIIVAQNGAWVDVRGDVGKLTVTETREVAVDGSVQDVIVEGAQATLVSISEPVDTITKTGMGTVIYKHEGDDKYRSAVLSETLLSEQQLIHADPYTEEATYGAAMIERFRNDRLEQFIHNASGFIGGIALEGLTNILMTRDYTRNVTDFSDTPLPRYSVDGFTMVSDIRDRDLRTVLAIVDEFQAEHPDTTLDLQAIRDFIGVQRYLQLEKLTGLIDGEPFVPHTHTPDELQAEKIALKKQITEKGYSTVEPHQTYPNASGVGKVYIYMFPYSPLQDASLETSAISFRMSPMITMCLPDDAPPAMVYSAPDGSILVDGKGASAISLSVKDGGTVEVNSLDVQNLTTKKTEFFTIQKSHIANATVSEGKLVVVDGKVYEGNVGTNSQLITANADIGKVSVSSGAVLDCRLESDIGVLKMEDSAAAIVKGDIGILHLAEDMTISAQGEVGKAVKDGLDVTEQHRDVYTIINSEERLTYVPEPLLYTENVPEEEVSDMQYTVDEFDEVGLDEPDTDGLQDFQRRGYDDLE